MTSPLVARRHKNCETFLPLVQTIVIFANKLNKVNDSRGLGGTYFDDLLLYANYCTMITIRHFDENFKEKESHQKSKLNLIFAQSCFAEDYKVLSISMEKCILTILSSQIKNSSSLRSFGSYKNPFTFLLHLFPTETKETELNNYM